MANKRTKLPESTVSLRMTDIRLPLCEIGPTGTTRMQVQQYYSRLRSIGVSIRDAERGTEFALNIKNIRTNAAGNQVVYFEESYGHVENWEDRHGFQYKVEHDHQVVSTHSTLPEAKYSAREYFKTLVHRLGYRPTVTVRDAINGALYWTLS